MNREVTRINWSCGRRPPGGEHTARRLEQPKTVRSEPRGDPVASRMHVRIASCALGSHSWGATAPSSGVPRSGSTAGRGERHVSPSLATFPHSEADQCQPTKRAGFALNDHLRIGKGPCGSPWLVANDRDRHQVACDLGRGGPPSTPWVPDRRCGRGSRGVDVTPANEGGTHGPGARAN